MSAAMVWVRLRIHLASDRTSIRFGAPVRFRPVIKGADGERQLDPDRDTVTAIAAVASDDQQARPFQLAAGEYDVQAMLPSGELIAEEVHVDTGDGGDDAPYAGYIQTIILRLGTDSSYGDDDDWSYFAGAGLSSGSHRKFSSSKSENYAPDINVDVTIGTTVQLVGSGVTFDPSSWRDWLRFLEIRHMLGPEAEPLIRLSQNRSGLSVEKDGGFGGKPLRIGFVSTDMPRFDFEQIGEARLYASLTGSKGTRLFSLPWPWGSDSIHLGARPFEIIATENARELRCDPVLLDDRWAGLIAYLNIGRVDLASQILGQAYGALLGKFENPLAAAVGGYILLSSNRPVEGHWPDWLENLALRFPNFPDGAILRARWLLARNRPGDLDRAHDLLEVAVDRGLPFFTTGVAWLIEGLQRTSIDCPACRERLVQVRGVARSMDLGQAFTSFAIARPNEMRAAQEGTEFGAPPGIALDNPLGLGLMRRREDWNRVDLPEEQHIMLTRT